MNRGNGTKQVDKDASGHLDERELHDAVMMVYNMVNQHIPGWDEPPTKEACLEWYRRFDRDSTGLDKGEFHDFVAHFLADTPQKLMQRVGGSMLIKVALAPLCASTMKRTLKKQPLIGPLVKIIPVSMLSPVLTAFGDVIKAAIALKR